MEEKEPERSRRPKPAAQTLPAGGVELPDEALEWVTGGLDAAGALQNYARFLGLLDQLPGA